MSESSVELAIKMKLAAEIVRDEAARGHHEEAVRYVAEGKPKEA